MIWQYSYLAWVYLNSCFSLGSARQLLAGFPYAFLLSPDDWVWTVWFKQ